MTTLFEEYEQIKSLPNLIGKKFYWSNNSFDSGPFERRPINEFIIVNYYKSKKGYEDSIVYYQYLKDSLPGDCSVLKLLKFATPIDD